MPTGKRAAAPTSRSGREPTQTLRLAVVGSMTDPAEAERLAQRYAAAGSGRSEPRGGDAVLVSASRATSA